MANPVPLTMLFDKFHSQLTDREVEKLAHDCKVTIEETINNIETLGQYIFAANNSGEKDAADNELMGIFVRNIGGHAQDAWMVIQQAEKVIKERLEVKNA